ncbi:MAG: hypothetical protein NDJ18_00460 [candidate division Zixibacteria bacterium]|nr:hypothetical protein [candidate division Zixibacteria bacterium]
MPLREPAVSRRTLVITAAVIWGVVGLFLIFRAALYLTEVDSDKTTLVLASGTFGILLGLLKGKYIFARLAKQNVQRIDQLSPHKKKICIFAFQAWQSYLIVLVMIGLGMALRVSPLPRVYLIGIYLLIGVGLLVGSRAYLKR